MKKTVVLITSGKPDRAEAEDEDVQRCLRFPRFPVLRVECCAASSFPAFAVSPGVSSRSTNSRGTADTSIGWWTTRRAAKVAFPRF